MSSPTVNKEDKIENVTETLIEDDMVKKLCDQCHHYKDTGLSLVQPYNQIFPTGYVEHHESIQNLEVFEDDVWICTFPKSGKNTLIIDFSPGELECSASSDSVYQSKSLLNFYDCKSSQINVLFCTPYIMKFSVSL